MTPDPKSSAKQLSPKASAIRRLVPTARALWCVTSAGLVSVAAVAMTTVAIAADSASTAARIANAVTQSNPSQTQSAPASPDQSQNQNQNPNPPAPAPAPAPPPATSPLPTVSPDSSQITYNTGQIITIRMIDTIDSKTNRAGDVFHASLDEPLQLNNSVIVPRGTDVYVRLVQGTTQGAPNNTSGMHLQLVKMDFQGRSYSLVSSTYTAAGKMKAKHAGRDIGGGAILGTILGAALGGGRGAAAGAVVGAAGGGVYADTHKVQQVKVPAETRLDFTLEQPVTISVMPHPANEANPPSNATPPPSNTPPSSTPPPPPPPSSGNTPT
jgi:hypothetical protein